MPCLALPVLLRSLPCASTCNRSDGVLEQLLPSPDNGGEGGGGSGGGGGGGGAAIAFAVLRAMGTTMSEIENASLRLKPLVLSHAFTSPDELVQTLVAHYRGQVSIRIAQARLFCACSAHSPITACVLVVLLV